MDHWWNPEIEPNIVKVVNAGRKKISASKADFVLDLIFPSFGHGKIDKEVFYLPENPTPANLKTLDRILKKLNIDCWMVVKRNQRWWRFEDKIGEGQLKIYQLRFARKSDYMWMKLKDGDIYK